MGIGGLGRDNPQCWTGNLGRLGYAFRVRADKIQDYLRDIPMNFDVTIRARDVQELSNADAVTALFARLGWRTEVRIEQNPGNLGITAEGTVKPIKKIELIADQDGALQVYIFELASVTIANTRAIVRAFRERAGNYLLVFTSSYDRLDFVRVEQGEIRLNAPGWMVAEAWQDLNEQFPEVATDAFVVMPNRIHGIIWLVGVPLVGALDDGIGATTKVVPTLGRVVGTFKSITKDKYIDGVKRYGSTPFWGKVWQRNYYEHVIRNESTLNAVRDYIEANLWQWPNDPENPKCNG